jgi:hypothetical protein
MESSKPAAEAIPHEELLPRLAQYFLTEWMVRALRRELGSEELQFRAHRRWQTDWSRQKSPDVILPLINVQKPKFCNGLKHKHTNAIRWREPTFAIISKPNILFR